MINIIYDIVSIIAIISAILVITTSSPIISVLYLIAVFVCIATYLIIIGIGFIGISYIVVYVGAVAILILFVIIILNIRLAELSNVGNQYTRNLPITGLLGFAIFYQLISVVPNINILSTNNSILGIITNFSQFIGDISISNTNLNVQSVYNDIVADQIIVTIISIQVQSIGTVLYNINPI